MSERAGGAAYAARTATRTFVSRSHSRYGRRCPRLARSGHRDNWRPRWSAPAGQGGVPAATPRSKSRRAPGDRRFQGAGPGLELSGPVAVAAVRASIAALAVAGTADHAATW